MFKSKSPECDYEICGRTAHWGQYKKRAPAGAGALRIAAESPNQYMPPMPPGIPPPAAGLSFSLISETRASVVKRSEATDAAF